MPGQETGLIGSGQAHQQPGAATQHGQMRPSLLQPAHVQDNQELGLPHDTGHGAAGPRPSLLQAAYNTCVELEEEYRSRRNAALTAQEKDAVHDRFRPLLREALERLREQQQWQQQQQQWQQQQPLHDAQREKDIAQAKAEAEQADERAKQRTRILKAKADRAERGLTDPLSLFLRLFIRSSSSSQPAQVEQDHQPREGGSLQEPLLAGNHC